MKLDSDDDALVRDEIENVWRVAMATARAGSWIFSERDSVVAIAVYSLLIIANLSAIHSLRPRVSVAVVSGTLHLGFAGLHSYRLYRPFPFEVFGYAWPLGASLREAVILSVFGMLSLAVAVKLSGYRSAERP